MGFVIGGPARSDPTEFLFTHMNIHTFGRFSQPRIGAFACPRPVRAGSHTLDTYALVAYDESAWPPTPMTVVETDTFLDRAKDILTESHRAELVAYLATNPEAGQVIPGTGGARKVRWAIAGKGKRGGTRTVYYYHNDSVPLFLLDIYAKNEKTNLSEADKRSLKRLLPILFSRYRKRS
jgi:hypothetical protein